MDELAKKHINRHVELDGIEIVTFLESPEYLAALSTNMKLVNARLKSGILVYLTSNPTALFDNYMIALHTMGELLSEDNIQMVTPNHRLAKMLDKAVAQIRETHGVPSIQERLHITTKGEEL